MRQKVFIVGASGNVWTELINQIQEKDWKWLNINPTEILWVANSKNFISFCDVVYHITFIFCSDTYCTK